RLVDPVRPRPVDLIPRRPEARADEDVRTLAKQRQELVVDRLDRGLAPGRMREPVHTPAEQILEVLELVRMRGDAEPVAVRLVDDRLHDPRRHLAAPCVVPDLDPAVDPPRGELADARSRLLYGRDEVDRVAQLAGGPGIRRRDPGLFMLPGVGHCRGGAGPDEWDPLA